MRTKWSKKIPRPDGFYWCRYETKGFTFVAPCQVVHFKEWNNAWIVSVFRYGDFYSHSPDELARHALRFGPEIRLPKINGKGRRNG